MRCPVGAARRPPFRLCRTGIDPPRRFRADGPRAMSDGTALDGGSVLHLPPHVKFRFDERRHAWIVLAPERLFLPDEQAVEILRLIDGARTVDAVVDDLAPEFAAPPPEIPGHAIPILTDPSPQ